MMKLLQISKCTLPPSSKINIGECWELSTPPAIPQLFLLIIISNMTVILVVISALRTTSKRLVNELEGLEIRGQVETIQTTALLKLASILKRVLET